MLVEIKAEALELLQDGFERLTRLWAAAQSGLF
jgi:hypothetical protein